MSNCDACKRTDVKCCNTCARNASVCEVWHTCGEDCLIYENKPMTNGDRIRSMTDEELAEFLSDYDYDSNEPSCDEVYEWLKSEVECE